MQVGNGVAVALGLLQFLQLYTSYWGNLVVDFIPQQGEYNK